MRLFNKFKSMIITVVMMLIMLLFTGCADVLDVLNIVLSEPDSVVNMESTQLQKETEADKETVAATQSNKETIAPTQSNKETTAPTQTVKPTQTETESKIDKNGYYYSKNEVALYIHTYGKLPGNYITKAEAQKLGWSGGSVEKYAKDKAIGGDYFGNYEGLLPKKSGRKYTECDIDTHGKSSRGAKRIIFSNDGLVYYTDNHYESFILLYGTP